MRYNDACHRKSKKTKISKITVVADIVLHISDREKMDEEAN